MKLPPDFRKRVLAREWLVGTFLNLGSPMTVEIAGLAGFDWILIDHEHGSWHHQLAPDNTLVATVWPGKADLYHAFQATLIPRLPLAPSLATAIARGLLR